MKFGWETREEQVLRRMKIPLEKRLELMTKINEFTNKFSTKKTKKIRMILREKMGINGKSKI